jgi:hypothetical protein
MVAGNRERAQQLAYLNSLLNEPEPDAPENVSASDPAPVDTPHGQRT